jgi:lactoylglutathione lyase
LRALQNKFIYTGIHVANLERSIQFYTKALGMKLMFKDNIKETRGRVAWLKSKGTNQILELNWYPAGYRYGARSGLDHLAFQVRDVRDEYVKLTRKHVGTIAPFIEGNWMLAYIKDPDGNWIELGQRMKPSRRKHKA